MKAVKIKVLIIMISILLLASSLSAKLARLEISGSYFFPSEKAFRNIYGSGAKWGLDISRSLF